VREFPRFLSAIHANCPDQAIRDIIVGNLWEEHGGLVPTRDHPAIFRAFGRALGLSDEEMEAAEPIPEVQAFIDRHEVVAKNRPFWEGIAGVTIGLEGQVPKTFGRIITALRERYGFSDDAIEFFIVHLTADSEHSGSGFDIIRRYVSDEAQIPVIRRAVKASLDAWRLMFDGIWRVATER
jgi:pyrroloquinoline-quinone synthase